MTISACEPLPAAALLDSRLLFLASVEGFLEDVSRWSRWVLIIDVSVSVSVCEGSLECCRAVSGGLGWSVCLSRIDSVV